MKEITERIYKYTLEIIDYQSIEMPLGAEILSMQMQQGKPCIWAVVEPNNPKKSRDFYIVGTGNPMPFLVNPKKFLGTFQLYSGDIIFHVFEGSN